MSVRRATRRDPTTGAAREYWIVDAVFERADGRRERVRKVPPVQTRRGAEEYERQVRAELLNPSPLAKEVPRFGTFVDERWGRRTRTRREIVRRPSRKRRAICGSTSGQRSVTFRSTAFAVKSWIGCSPNSARTGSATSR